MTSLRSLAESDLGVILENDSDGFGWSITITDPDGVSGSLIGMSGDIESSIDPETGMILSGRHATCTVRISELGRKGLAIPKGVADSTKKPWVVEFNDINGSAHKFLVKQSDPDRTLGFVNLILGLYK